MPDITNMANALLDNPSKEGTLRWDVSIHHWRWSFGYLSPEVPYTATWHSVRLDSVCVSLYTQEYMCATSFMRIPQAQRDPVALLCSVLINPAMTEWIWQVMYVLVLGWECSEGKEHNSGVNAKTSKCYTKVSSRSTLGQVLPLRSPANSMAIV